MEEKINKKYIRNFGIIAHVDHGKSTLADRFIQITKTICDREMQNCVLDNMDLEREKGITIKARCILLKYKYNNEIYFMNLVDTPGHVDFQYEVERSLYALDVVILLIDATQGVGAQTLSNYLLAIKNPKMKIIIAINKIDSINADVDMCKKQIKNILHIDLSSVPLFLISARTGVGVEDLLKAIITFGNPPEGDEKAPLKLLIFDSWYDNYLGVIALVAIKDGILNKKDILFTKSNLIRIDANKFGYMENKMVEKSFLTTGEIGYIITNIKKTNLIHIGDTLVKDINVAALPGFKIHNPLVFCSAYLVDPNDFPEVLKSFEKLHLNDSSFFFKPESSSILGNGFRCGFFGLLHMEIIFERLAREYNINDLIITIPNVIYKIKKNGKDSYEEINNAIDLPINDSSVIIEEPMAKIIILTTESFLGIIKNLCFSRRGVYEDEEYVEGKYFLKYIIPLSEIILDFADQLKSISSGYASFDYEIIGYQKDNLCRVDFKINDELLPELSSIVHRNNLYEFARKRCIKLKENLSREQVEIRIQAFDKGKIIASEKISPYRKDVTAHCSGGDVNRKNKLLKKQAEGKKRLNKKITIPPQVFVKVIGF